MFLRQHHQGVGDDAHDDRRHAIQHVGGEADQVAEASCGRIPRDRCPRRCPAELPIKLAISRMKTDPTMAFAMPPPTSPGGFGVCVRKAQLIEPMPLIDQVAEDRDQRHQHQDHGTDGRHRDQRNSGRAATG